MAFHLVKGFTSLDPRTKKTSQISGVSSRTRAQSDSLCCLLRKCIGLFQKISTPPPPLWTTLNWVPKTFRISKKDNCSFCRIPKPADGKFRGIPEFRKNLNGFLGIPVKMYKFWEICGFAVILTEHFLQDF